MRRLPPLTALEAFIQVARTGSVKAAAAELALSTPALSRRVQALERYLGMTLFDRKHQHMELNPEGEKLMAEIAPVLDALGLAIEGVLKGKRELRLRLGVLPLFASQRLLPRMGELRRLYPDFYVDIDTSPQAHLRLGEGIDAAIILTKEIDPALYSKALGSDEIYLIAPKERVDGPGAIVSPDDLRNESVLVHRDMPSLFDDWLQAIGRPDLRPRDTQQFDSGQLMLEAVAQGFGIATLFAKHFESAHDTRLARLFEQDVRSPYSYYFVCRPRAFENKAVRVFHDWLLSAEI